jgi:hypothetical protein
MRGTPSFFLFEENLVLLDEWFGHNGEAERPPSYRRC